MSLVDNVTMSREGWLMVHAFHLTDAMQSFYQTRTCDISQPVFSLFFLKTSQKAMATFVSVTWLRPLCDAHRRGAVKVKVKSVERANALGQWRWPEETLSQLTAANCCMI